MLIGSKAELLLSGVSLLQRAASLLYVCIYLWYVCMYVCTCMHVCMWIIVSPFIFLGGGRSTPFRVSIACLHVNYCLSFLALPTLLVCSAFSLFLLWELHVSHTPFTQLHVASRPHSRQTSVVFFWISITPCHTPFRWFFYLRQNEGFSKTSLLLSLIIVNSSS